ncbi:hypothetical protein I4U23_018647 [Adineta vaga]|nr:hypothetical protein I4U23_018647 [Adineta vaga]
MNGSWKYLRYFLVVCLIICNVTCARRRRKACDESINEIFGSCANPCRQINCENRIYNTTLSPCAEPCQGGCVCKYGYVRRETVADPCVETC